MLSRSVPLMLAALVAALLITRLGFLLTVAGSLVLIAVGFTAAGPTRERPRREPFPYPGRAPRIGGTGRTIRWG